MSWFEVKVPIVGILTSFTNNYNALNKHIYFIIKFNSTQNKIFF